MKRTQTLKTLFPYLRPYFGWLIASLTLSLFTVALTLYVPILIGQAVDLIIGEGRVDFGGILRILVTICVAVFFTAVAQWLMSYCNNKISYGIVRDIRHDAFARIRVLPLRYLDSHPVGDLVSRVIVDVDSLADGLHIEDATDFEFWPYEE